MPAAKWKPLGKGVKTLSLWNTIGPAWPQVVLLQLSKGEYEKFLKNPRDYVNDLKVLGRSSTHKVYKFDMAPVKKGTLANTTYMVVLKHEMETTSSVFSSSNVKPLKP
jgi:hypothetical protein